MITIDFIGFDGREVKNFRITKLLRVGDESYPPEPPVPAVKELSDRLTILEALIAQVIGDASSQQPHQEPCSAGSS